MGAGNGRATRQQLLHAARRVIARDGATSLTLDAVAREAGRSKGTLLYHFPSKRALVGALLDDLYQVFDQLLAERLADEPEAPGRWLRAYIRAAAEDAFAAPEPTATVGVLALVTADVELLAAWRARARRWLDLAGADGLGVQLGLAVLFAADGLWLSDLFDLAPPVGPARERIVGQLLDLTRATAPVASLAHGAGQREESDRVITNS